MISARNIRKRFGSLEVLKGLNLDIADGRVTTITGPSGAGKTTLLQILGTLDAPEPGGSVIYDATDVSALSDSRLSRFRNANIGFVFQAHRLLPEFTLTENVAMPALIGGAGMDEACDRARRLLCRMGLGERLHHKPSELSGGECQRAAVARALVNAPRVVLADEPTGSLDSENRRRLHSLFFELRDEMGATFVIVTHDEGLAADADVIVHLVDGRLQKITDKV